MRKDYNQLTIKSTVPDVVLPDELGHFVRIIDFGATKHSSNNWLKKEGAKSSYTDMHKSMLHHLGQSCGEMPHLEMLNHLEIGYNRYRRDGRPDEDTDEDTLLHLTCRAMMCYTRFKRGFYE